MNWRNSIHRFLPSLVSLLIGVAVSGATLAYYRGNAFDVIIVGATLYVLVFAISSMLFAAALWAIGYISLGRLGREQFQTIWIGTATVIQVLIALLSTYDLKQLGVFDDFFSNLDYPQLAILVLPYVATFQSLANFMNNESPEERVARIAKLGAIDSELRKEKAKSRAGAALPVVVCAFLGGVVGWLFPLEPGAHVFTSVLGGSTGIPVGMLIHRYLPSQRRLRELEKAKEDLRW